MASPAPPSPAEGGGGEGPWSREEDKAFENALATLLPAAKAEEDGMEDGKTWDEIAERVAGRTTAEVRRHYELLVEDVRAIEAGKIPVPCYVGEDDKASPAQVAKDKDHNHHQANSHRSGGFSEKRFDFGGGQGKGSAKSEQERRKGIPWTEEEHKLFLLGLEKFGKGDWRSISRNYVISRTPTQVASHAQKYFIRLNSMNRDRRRSSIHDITSVNGGEASTSQGHITGQGNTNSMSVGSSTKHPPQPNMPPVGIYGPPVCHPVTGHMAAVGTPVVLPPGHAPYVVPVAFPVPPPTMHR